MSEIVSRLPKLHLPLMAKEHEDSQPSIDFTYQFYFTMLVIDGSQTVSDLMWFAISRAHMELLGLPAVSTDSSLRIFLMQFQSTMPALD